MAFIFLNKLNSLMNNSGFDLCSPTRLQLYFVTLLDCSCMFVYMRQVFRDQATLEDKYEEVASDDVMSMAVRPSRLLMSVR